jgi:hypothetical protein
VRYKRPLWLIFVLTATQLELPTPRQAEAIYDERFSIEYSIRFLKGELGATWASSTVRPPKEECKSGSNWWRPPFGCCGHCVIWPRLIQRSFPSGGEAAN